MQRRIEDSRINRTIAIKNVDVGSNRNLGCQKTENRFTLIEQPRHQEVTNEHAFHRLPADYAKISYLPPHFTNG